MDAHAGPSGPKLIEARLFDALFDNSYYLVLLLWRLKVTNQGPKDGPDLDIRQLNDDLKVLGEPADDDRFDAIRHILQTMQRLLHDIGHVLRGAIHTDTSVPRDGQVSLVGKRFVEGLFVVLQREGLVNGAQRRNRFQLLHVSMMQSHHLAKARDELPRDVRRQSRADTPQHRNDALVMVLHFVEYVHHRASG